MIILDSLAWLEYFAGTKNGEIFPEFAENFDELVVPSICLYEVFKIATDFMRNGIVVDITSELSINVAKISLEYKLPMPDSLIYATSKIIRQRLLLKMQTSRD